jgi:2-keto-3-deoxy-L-rhamnonate aldolase RhmA
MNLRTLWHDNPVIGTMLSELYVPNILHLLAQCQYSYVIVDCEHGYFDFTQVANLAAVARGIALTLLVRVPEPDRALISKYLDMGVDGILLANTETSDQAGLLTDICRYAPDGSRGVSTFRAHTGYRNGKTETLLRDANERLILLCQIESEAAANQADSIVSIPGIDGVLIGPNDMSQRMGIISQFMNSRMQRAISSVMEAADKAGKVSGVITANEALLRACAAKGGRVFCMGSELHFLSGGAQDAHARCIEWIKFGEWT